MLDPEGHAKLSLSCLGLGCGDVGDVRWQSFSGDGSPERIPTMTRVRRSALRGLREAARPMAWCMASVLDFLIEDTCALCGRPGRPEGSAGTEISGPAAHLLEPVKQRLLFGRLVIINHPVCVPCASHFEAARDSGLLGRMTAGGIVETTRGERFGVDDGSGAVLRPAAVRPVPIRVVSPFMTNDNVLQIIHLIKFTGYRALVRPVARSIGAAVGAIAPELLDDAVLVPTPMEARDLRRRGFNQAQEIASGVADYLGLERPVAALCKTGRTVPQSRTPHGRRARNVRGAFAAVDEGIRGRHVLLVDDLLTTGATAASCAAAVCAAGARRVTVLCFGRAM